MNTAQQLAFWADRLRDLSASGLHFDDNPYARERYQVVQDIAMQMLAYATGETPVQFEPLRATVFAHLTPFTTGDAAVIDAEGRVLLIQRADTQRWALPGGALEVGETPAEGVTREALEETGVRSRPLAFVGVFDSLRCGSASRHHMYHFLFLCQPLELPGDQPPSHARETLGNGWFSEEDLPTDIEPGHEIRIREAYRMWRGDPKPFFDI